MKDYVSLSESPAFYVAGIEKSSLNDHLFNVILCAIIDLLGF